MRKPLMLCTAALAATFAGNASFAAYTSASYVREGLVAQWDGIDNAGTGTHDPNATVWKDLKGSLDMTLTSKGSWTNGNALAALGKTAAAVGNDAAPTYKTIEVVFKRTDKYSRILFNSGDKKRMVVFDDNPPNASGTIVTYFSGNTSSGSGGLRTKSVRLPIHNTDSRPELGETFFLAACYDDDGTVTDIFRNADPQSTYNWYNEWNAGPAVSVGGRNTSSEYPWEGEIFAIRLYSTRLAKAQLAHNHRIDCKRFFTSKSYIQSGLTSHWDGLDNAGFGVHDASSATWTNLVSGAQALTVKTGVWSDDALMCKASAAADGAGAGLVLDTQAFDRKHKGESITLVECKSDSADALSNLAANIAFADADLHGRVAVADGVKLVYTASRVTAFSIIIQ